MQWLNTAIRTFRTNNKLLDCPKYCSFLNWKKIIWKYDYYLNIYIIYANKRLLLLSSVLMAIIVGNLVLLRIGMSMEQSPPFRQTDAWTLNT